MLKVVVEGRLFGNIAVTQEALPWKYERLAIDLCT
jgi:hypothetical protein